MSTNDSLEEKNNQNSEEEENSSATDKSPDDLEVYNILSHPKADQQNTEHRANLIVSLFTIVIMCCTLNTVVFYSVFILIGRM